MENWISIKDALESLFVGWSFVEVDVKGRSRGLAIGWKWRSWRCDNVCGFGLVLGVKLLCAYLGWPSHWLMSMAHI